MDNIELALEIINLKIVKESNNAEKNYFEFNKKIKALEEEKRKIYLNDKDVIDKVINVYGKEIRKNN